MTKKSFETLLKRRQQELHLTSWHIHMRWDDTLTQSAKTLPDARYLRAEMTVNPSVADINSIANMVITHELIHIVMAEYDYFVDNCIKDEGVELIGIMRERCASALTSVLLNKEAQV